MDKNSTLRQSYFRMLKMFQEGYHAASRHGATEGLANGYAIFISPLSN